MPSFHIHWFSATSIALANHRVATTICTVIFALLNIKLNNIVKDLIKLNSGYAFNKHFLNS